MRYYTIIIIIIIKMVVITIIIVVVVDEEEEMRRDILCMCVRCGAGSPGCSNQNQQSCLWTV